MNQSHWTSAIFAGLTTALMICHAAAAGTIGQTQPVAISQNTTINNRQVREILDTMQAASNNRNIENITKFLAPNVVIQMAIQFNANSQNLRLNREQYRQYLQQGFELTERYSGKYSNLKIQVMPNRKSAIATYRLLEEVTLKGQSTGVTSTSNVSMKFEVIQGQILVTVLKTATKLEVK
jgi:hypothetical protein